jgi:hypothetical protein
MHGTGIKITVITIYMKVFFLLRKIEVHYLCRVAKLIKAHPAPFVALLFSFELCY